MSTPTQITIHPAPSASTGLFGADGFTAKDVVDTINPLNHIPFVSTLYEEATGSVASTASKLIGGALLGGPIGFLVGLANVIFEGETGHSVGGAVVASLSGEETAATAAAAKIADASATNPQTGETIVAELLVPQAATPTPPPGIDYSAIARQAQMQMAASMGSNDPDAQAKKDRDVLALFGGSTPSAHNSYKKAQMLPYLQDVSTSMVL